MVCANGVLVLADDTRRALDQTDEALLSHAQMLASAVATAKAIGAPINVSQKLFQSIDEAIGAVLDSRRATQSSLSIMRGVAREMGFVDALVGCPDGYPTGKADHTAPVAVAA